MALMHPDITCYSVTVKRPIKDMNRLSRIGPVSFQSGPAISPEWVDLNLRDVETISHEIEYSVGITYDLFKLTLTQILAYGHEDVVFHCQFPDMGL